MNIKLIKPIVTGAATLAMLCSCGGNGKVSFSEFIKKAKEKNLTKYVCYDNCSLNGDYTWKTTSKPVEYKNLTIYLKYDPKGGYIFDKASGSDADTIKWSQYIFNYYYLILPIPYLLNNVIDPMYDDKAIDNIGRYIECKVSPSWSLKGNYSGNYVEVEYDDFGMPTHFYAEENCSGMDDVVDFKVTNSGNTHLV